MKIVKHMKKRAMGLMLCLCLLAGLVSGCSAPKEKPMGEDIRGIRYGNQALPGVYQGP